MAPVPATIPYWIYLLATAFSILGLCIILANSFLMAFYKKKWKETVPLMYLMMAVCDSVTGIVVLGHAVIFVNHGIEVSQLFQDDDLYYKADVLTTSVYIILQSCTRASVFYNTVLTVVRTINIARPFYLIRKHIVIVIAILYPILWVTICTSHVVEAKNSWYNGTTMTGMIFQVLPGNTWLNSFELTALTVILVMVIPLFLPTILALVSAVIQIYSILKPSIISPPSVRERSMTVTIIMLTMLCLVCNIPYTMFFVSLFFLSSYQPSHLYIMSTVLPFIQALLNPVILISRGAAVRKFAFKVVRRPFKKRNTADGVETEMVVISN